MKLEKRKLGPAIDTNQILHNILPRVGLKLKDGATLVIMGWPLLLSAPLSVLDHLLSS